MRNFLIILFFLLTTNLVFAQNNNFDLQKLKSIKEYKSFQLENGLTVLCLKNNDTSGFFVRSYTDLPEYVAKNYQAFISVERELRKLSDFRLPGNWTQNTLDDTRILLNKDVHGYYATCPIRNLDICIQLFNSLFQRPVIQPNNLEMAKKAILMESDSLMKLPEDKIDKITKSIIYGKNHPILKYTDQLQMSEVTKEKYDEFYERFHKPNNSFLLVMGNISPDSLKVLVDKSFIEWKKKEIPESGYKLIPIEEPKIVFFDTVPTGKTNIKILFPFALYPFTFNAEQAELLSVLFQDLLSEKLINEMQLANKVDARFESDKITGNYQLNVAIEKDSLNLVIQAIISTIADLKKANYSQEKLKLAKEKIISKFKKYQTSDEYISWLIINTETKGLPKEYYADFIEEIEKIDQNGMITFAAKYLNYNTALFQIPGHWYQSLNDFIKLCKDFRIELYELDGRLKKFIPKGFNGFSVVDNYIESIGGFQNISKIDDVSIRFGAIYELPNDEKMYVDGEMLHKSGNKYFTQSRMIRPKKDTTFLQMQLFDGVNGFDSTMQSIKMLKGTDLELLKYKSSFVPEMSYKTWQYQARLVKADTLGGRYIWVVLMENPAKQQIIDFYDVDKGIRYKRIVTDAAFYDQRTITYGKYQRNDEKEILYPYLKTIVSKNTTIRMIIREVDYKTKIDKKLFEIAKQP